MFDAKNMMASSDPRHRCYLTMGPLSSSTASFSHLMSFVLSSQVDELPEVRVQLTREAQAGSDT